MGNENARHEARSDKQKRPAKSTEKRLTRFREVALAKRGEADWGTVEANLLSGLVIAATRAGAAITFGLSRDGGAYMCTLLLDGDKETIYIGASQDVDYELRAIGLMLEDLSL